MLLRRSFYFPWYSVKGRIYNRAMYCKKINEIKLNSFLSLLFSLFLSFSLSLICDLVL